MTLLFVVLCGCGYVRRGGREPLVGRTTSQPPSQPATGPGGREYLYGRVESQRYGIGAAAYWIFTPADPVPATAPVVLFVHGWSAIEPGPYQAWIDHLVRRGHVVIYPVYQNLLFNLGLTVDRTARRATKAALAQLESGPIRPEVDHFAIVGHSLGGAIALNLAMQAADAGLPRPRALLVTQPGCPPWFPLAAPEELPGDLHLLVLVGDRDRLAGDRLGREIYERAAQLPTARRSLVVLLSDDHGTPPLIADHFSVCAPNLPEGVTHQPWGPWWFGVDALDYYGYWRLFDALMACAFSGQECEHCTAGTPRQIDMGQWSDGVPVKSLLAP